MRAILMLHLALTIAVIALPGCGSEGTTTNSNETEIMPLPETAPYRTLILKDEGPVHWLDPQSLGDEFMQGPLATKDPARAQFAIQKAADQLASIDYAALSLPAFVTYTRSLEIKPADFTGDNTELEAVANSSTTNIAMRWALYRWVGPKLPPHPDRPLVTRWIHVYALYDTTTLRVVRLAPTIWGQVEE
jgi:hypothetical protein